MTEYKMEKLEEIPIVIPENILRWSPVSAKLKYLRKSMMNLAKELKKEEENDKCRTKR